MSTILNDAPQAIRWDKELYYQMGEFGWFNGKRVELINGEIYEMSPIGSRHAVAVTLVMHALNEITQAGYFLFVQGPIIGKIARIH